MRIVIVADHAHINGGQARVAIDSAIGLKKRGHDVVFFAAVAPVEQSLLDAGVEVVCTNQDDIATATSKAGFLVQATWNREAAHRLAGLLEQSEPANSIVHVHAWAKALSPSIGPVILTSPVAAVSTLHEYYIVCPNGGFYQYPADKVCRLTPLSAACLATSCDAQSYPRKLWRAARQTLVNRRDGLLHAIEDVITISDTQFAAVQPYMPAETRWHRVDNPIDVADLGPKPALGEGGFLYVGRASREKGIEHFLQAARIAGIAANVVGDGPMLAELRARFPEANFLGWRKPPEVRALMRQARALVFPSIWYEGQPLTVYEALALGTPVISSDVNAGREGIVEGENGFVFRSADAAHLAERMTALTDDETASRMAARAYELYWAKPMTLERHLDSLERVYAAALAARRP